VVVKAEGFRASGRMSQLAESGPAGRLPLETTGQLCQTSRVH
jgi:hypothetical protein